MNVLISAKKKQLSKWVMMVPALRRRTSLEFLIPSSPPGRAEPDLDSRLFAASPDYMAAESKSALKWGRVRRLQFIFPLLVPCSEKKVPRVCGKARIRSASLYLQA